MSKSIIGPNHALSASIVWSRTPRPVSHDGPVNDVVHGHWDTRFDKVADALAAEGIVLEDGPGGTTWRREA